MAAGADAAQHAGRVVEPQQFAQAESAVEVIAGTGRDLGLLADGPLDHRGHATGNGQRIGHRMHHEGVHGHALLDGHAQLGQALPVPRRGVQPQHPGDLVGLLLVEAQDHVEAALELHDQVEGVTDVLPGALLRIGQVEEHLPARALQRRHQLRMQALPDRRHVREHGPVDEGHEARGGELGGELLLAVALAQVVPVDLLEGVVLAHHQLAVLELEGVGEPRLTDAVDLGACGERLEHRMQGRPSQRPHIGHADAQAGQRIGHDRAVAPQLGQHIHQLDIGAASSGGGQPLRVGGDGGDAIETDGVIALVHHVEDLVHEAVETHEGGQRRDLGRGGGEAGGDGCSEFGRVLHGR